MDNVGKRRWGPADADTKWEQTFLALVIEPAVNFIVRTGEITVLAGAFSAAAHITKIPLAYILAELMLLALALHFGLALGRYVFLPLAGKSMKATWKNFLTLSLAGGAGGLLWYFIWYQMVAIVGQIVNHP